METILKADAALNVDVHCYVCDKRMALSNAIQMAGRYLCGKCESEFVEATATKVELGLAHPKPVCIRCNKTPSEIQEYIDAAEQDGFGSPDDYVRQEEGTYNRESGHFLCTECYVAAGCPSSPRGWVAP